MNLYQQPRSSNPIDCQVEMGVESYLFSMARDNNKNNDNNDILLPVRNTSFSDGQL